MKRNHVIKHHWNHKHVLTGIICFSSSALVVYWIFRIATSGPAIDNALTKFFSVVLTDKALGTTIGILLMSVVGYFIYLTAKKHS